MPIRTILTMRPWSFAFDSVPLRELDVCARVVFNIPGQQAGGGKDPRSLRKRGPAANAECVGRGC